MSSKYTDEFKAAAVAQLGAGCPLKRLASELGVTPQALRGWRDRASGAQATRLSKGTALPAPRSPATQDAEVAQLRAELARVRLHNEILKKAVAICSGDPR
jgi:transposase-like protein